MSKRQDKLKEIILSLHSGTSLEDAIREFRKHFDSVTTKEITDMEQALMKDEVITANQIQSLCDVHAAVFEGSIEDIHSLEGFLEKEESLVKGIVKMDAGSLSFEDVNAIFNTLPLDMTFVDANGHVKYFTQEKTRIFHRPKTVIGRHVSMCHPPQSVDIVEEIIEDLRSGKKEYEDFWIDFKEMFVYIRYFAVRDKDGTFLGTLEVTQDIKPIKMIEGTKRLR